MKKALNTSLALATLFALLCGALTAQLFAQTKPMFVLPNIGGTPAPASTPSPAPRSMAVATPAGNPMPQPAASPAPPPAEYVMPLPAPVPVAASTTAKPHTPAQVANNPELIACRKRYSEAVYNIGLALWTAPAIQRPTLGRLLNAAVAAQPVIIATDQTNPFCSDATLSNLEAAVIRLKAKGWVPKTDVEEHVARSTDVNEELKYALDAVNR